MLYLLLKFPARLALWIWCRKWRINNKTALSANGPLLIAANHPNSFLDAILVCSIFKQPVYSLARGDAFQKPAYNKLLRAMNMLPVYRLSEGAENLEENYRTFADCINIFKRNGIVLIFSEGRCINEWNLRPLKKGTARLATEAWSQNIPLTVIPLGINYSSFNSFGKNIRLFFGEVITQETIAMPPGSNYGSKILAFNEALRNRLQHLVISIKPPVRKIIEAEFAVPISRAKKILLFVPAVIGFIFHAPLYLPVKKISLAKFGDIDHYDSVVVGLLFMLYPFYLLFAACVVNYLLPGYLWLGIVAMPLTARSYIQLKKQF